MYSLITVSYDVRIMCAWNQSDDNKSYIVPEYAVFPPRRRNSKSVRPDRLSRTPALSRAMHFLDSTVYISGPLTLVRPDVHMTFVSEIHGGSIGGESGLNT